MTVLKKVAYDRISGFKHVYVVTKMFDHYFIFDNEDFVSTAESINEAVEEINDDMQYFKLSPLPPI